MARRRRTAVLVMVALMVAGLAAPASPAAARQPTGEVSPVAISRETDWPPTGMAYRFLLVRDNGSLLAFDVTAGQRRQHQVAPPCDACGYVGGTLVTPDGRRVFAAVQRGAKRWVVALDPATERVLWRSPIGRERLFTTSADGALVYLLDDATATRLAVLDAGNGGRRQGVALAHRAERPSPDRTTAYALDRSTGTLTSVDLSTGIAGPAIALGDVTGWALSPDGTAVLVSRPSPDSPAGCAWQSCRTEFQAFDLVTAAAGATIRHDAESILQEVTADGRGLVVLPVRPKGVDWTVVAAPDGPTVPVAEGTWQPLAGQPTTVTSADGGSMLVRSQACYLDCVVAVMQTVPATGEVPLAFIPLGDEYGASTLSSPSVAPMPYPLPAAVRSPGPVPGVGASRAGAVARVAWRPAARAAWYQTRLSRPGGSFDPYQGWVAWLGTSAALTGLRPGRPYRVQVRGMGPGGPGPAATVRLPVRG